MPLLTQVLCHSGTFILSLHLITSDTKQTLADVTSVNCTLSGGPVKILPHHAPMIATVERGKLYAVRSDGVKSFEIASAGLLKVEKDVVTIVS